MNFVYSVTVLALTVAGLAIVFGLLRVMNMAHGEFVALGAYSALIIQQSDLPFVLAVPLAIALCATLGWLIEWTIIRHLYSRPFDTLLATWGLAIVMREGIEAAFGREFKSVDQVLPGTVDLHVFDYPAYRLVLIAVTVLMLGILLGWFKRSNAGARIKAMVENPGLAEAAGIDTEGLARKTFVVGVSITGVAGVLLAPLVRVEPYMGFDYLLSSFFVLVVGGLGTLEGVLIGSAVIGGTDAAISTIFDKTAGYLGVLLLSILFLWLRPHGIYSRQ